MSDLKERFEKMKMDRTKRYEGVNLYVKNLDDVIDDDRLRKEFSQFGTITSARVWTALVQPSLTDINLKVWYLILMTLRLAKYHLFDTQ